MGKLLYVLYGEDDFSIKEYIKQIKADISSSEFIDGNITLLQAKDISFQQLVANCAAVPFLSPKRLVIVDGLLDRFEVRDGKTKTKKDISEWDSLGNYVDIMPETTVLVLVDRKIKKSNPLLVMITPHARVMEFKPLVGDRLKYWINSNVKQLGSNISLPAVDLLAELIGNNLWMMTNEINKLCSFTHGRRIEEDDVRLLVENAREANVFAMVDAVLSRNLKMATRLLHQLVDEGSAPPYLLVMITRQFRMVLQSKDLLFQKKGLSEISKILGITSEYGLSKTIQQAKKHSLYQLKYIYEQLLDADISIKTGRIKGDKGELALDLLIIKLCNAPKDSLDKI